MPIIDLSDPLTLSVAHTTLPGAAGGLAAFLLSIRKGTVKNNKYIRKLLMEITGGAITASFVAVLISNPPYQDVVAFCVGASWAVILERIRVKVTKLVVAALGENIE